MSLRGIKPLSPASSDFPYGDYDAAAKEFINYACTMPKYSTTHPLNSKNPQSNSLSSSQKGNQKVFFLGGPWNEYGPSNPGPRTHHVRIPEDVPLFCCALLSIISPEEFPHRFNKKAPGRDLIKEASNVVGGRQAKARIKITDRHSHSFRVFNKNQLKRVSERTGSRITVSQGVWRAMPNGGNVRGCWDGYFLALPGFKKGDEYTIDINAESQMFDARRDGPLKFIVKVKAVLKVV